MNRTVPSLLLTLLAFALIASSGCRQVQLDPSAEHKQEARATQPALRDLSRDESLGGHTLSRHVGKTDDELRDRLAHEHISAASTYTDRAAAARAVGGAIVANQERIRNWEDSRGGHPNLVLDYDSPQPIGRTLRRGQTESSACAHVIVVLKWHAPADSYVLTSYPECR